jgi:DUF438 domain-containing protein
MSQSMKDRGEKIRKLEEIIKSLHGGAPPATVKARLKDIVRQTDSSEIAAMEEQLISGGMPVDEVRSMCDLHAEVLKEILVEPPADKTPPGHPVDTFRRENEALYDAVGRTRAIVAEFSKRPEGDEFQNALMRLRQALNELMDIDKHYQRKENLLFARLEKHGIYGPPKVMWAKDDEVRQLLKRAERMLSHDPVNTQDAATLISTTIEPALDGIAGMIYKEENILLPMALNALSDEDWAEIWRDSPDYGWCLVEPREGYRPPQSATETELSGPAADHALRFPSGSLTPEQLRAILAVLPVELTFVDADDCVRYFSENPDQIFKRTKTILGRKVQNCHPPASVHVVQKVLDDFRSGRQNLAEFWLDFKGKFVHIRYFAVRDPAGKYLGALEVTQDITRLRTLEGQRRLLQYD